MFREGEWITMSDDPEVGGQGLPRIIGTAAKEYLTGADFSFTVFGMASGGAAKLLERYGTEKQKKLFLRKMNSGEWGGTMVVSEPDAGTDVGSLTTTAIKNPDGTYSISGNKVFITNGDHDLTENIIHPVMARIEGAPKGTKGISLFLVPKIWLNEDGRLGEPNDVVCTGIEKKMGLHASPTCSLTFGGKGKCRGLLLGEENKGLKIILQMMNSSRLGIGALGLFSGSCAYLYAVNYAKERIQGKDITDFLNPDASSVPIIRHPDVRRMLLWMKSHVEGMRSFVYFLCYLFDKEACAAAQEEKEYCLGLIELLTPVVKAYCTDRGYECSVQAMQVMGAYGYSADYPVERLLRNSKINSIYEGTNGIQAMDLLGRKIGMKEGKVFKDFVGEVNKIIVKAKEIEDLANLAENLEAVLNRLETVTKHMSETFLSSDMKVALSFASPFLKVMGDTVMAWMLLWRAVVASSKLNKVMGDDNVENQLEQIAQNKNAAFYHGQIKSAEYFINTILPVTHGTLNAIEGSCSAVVDILEESFAN
ncbi:MAG: acyl-CoA dehydrogenase [Deltaproteobacteria bacterium]|nr:acyl-CoA dehydrogenase [Deltaproteobacteria bacterium]